MLQAEYAVRGAIVIRAMELGAKLRKGEKLPFDNLVFCNIGNPQSLQQKPLSFNRSVMALMEYPQLLELEGDMPKVREARVGGGGRGEGVIV